MLFSVGRASNYLYPDSSFRNGNGITVGLLFNIFFCVFLRLKYVIIYKEDIGIRILLNMMLGAIFFSCWLNGLGIIAQRGGQSMNVALCFMWTLFLTNQKGGKKIIWYTFFVAYLLMMYMRPFTMEGLEERMLLPFKFVPSSLFR